MELMIDCGVFVASQRIPRDGRHLRGRCQPHGTARDGSSTGRRGRSCETKTLQSARHLPDDSAAPEPGDDRTRYVALVPATKISRAPRRAASIYKQTITLRLHGFLLSQMSTL